MRKSTVLMDYWTVTGHILVGKFATPNKIRSEEYIIKAEN